MTSKYSERKKVSDYNPEVSHSHSAEQTNAP